MKHHDDNLPQDPHFSFNKREERPFGLPSDYFSSFEEKLKSRMEAQNELIDFPTLYSIQKTPVFEMPENYFSKAEKTLELKAELAAYPILESLTQSAMDSLTEDYREKVTESLSYKIKVLDELKPYATLYNLDKINVFTVADEYFDTLAERVKKRIYSEKAEHISVWQSLVSLLFDGRMAWSLGLALVLGFAFYFNQTTQTISETGDCETLACLERDEILNNKAITNFDEEQLMDLVDVNSLDRQLNLDIAKPDSITGTEMILQNTDTDELLDAP